MELKVKLYLTDDEGIKYMGIGVLWLLEEIQKTGSLRQASISLGISYSKCYQMISKAEKELRHPLVERRKGGAQHEGAVLTGFALEFMDFYRDFQKRVKEKAEDEFRAFSRSFTELSAKEDSRNESEL